MKKLLLLTFALISISAFAQLTPTRYMPIFNGLKLIKSNDTAYHYFSPTGNYVIKKDSIDLIGNSSITGTFLNSNGYNYLFNKPYTGFQNYAGAVHLIGSEIIAAGVMQKVADTSAGLAYQNSYITRKLAVHRNYISAYYERRPGMAHTIKLKSDLFYVGMSNDTSTTWDSTGNQFQKKNATFEDFLLSKDTTAIGNLIDSNYIYSDGNLHIDHYDGAGNFGSIINNGGWAISSFGNALSGAIQNTAAQINSNGYDFQFTKNHAGTEYRNYQYIQNNDGFLFKTSTKLTSQNLIKADSSGLDFSTNALFDDDLTVTGTLTANGNLNSGDALTDTTTITGNLILNGSTPITSWQNIETTHFNKLFTDTLYDFSRLYIGDSALHSKSGTTVTHQKISYSTAGQYGLAITNTVASATNGGAIMTVQSSDGAALETGHRLGVYGFSGSTSATTTGIGAMIAAFSDGAFGASNDNPGKMVFYTVPDGSSTVFDRMTLNGNGRIYFGSQTGVTPALDLETNPNAATTFGKSNTTTAASNGFSFTISGGGSGTNADKSAGGLYLKSGRSTGTGNGQIVMQTPTPGATGTATHAEVDREVTLTYYLVDNATFSLGTGRSGLGIIQLGDGEEYAWFNFTTAGVVTLITNSANVTTTLTTNDKLNIGDGGTSVTIENTFTAAKVVTVKVIYNL